MRCTFAFALAAATLLSSVAVPAQEQIDRDIEFVRNLARKLGFISLAQSEVELMKQRYKDRQSDFQQVAQLGIEVSLIGAKIHPNREEKRTLFKRATDDLLAFLERYSTGKTALSARISLADATMEFGRFLSEEIEVARTEDPDKVADLEKEAGQVFKQGVEACDQAMKELENVDGATDPQGRINFHLSWLRKGILLREHGRAVKKDRGYLIDRSRDTLEELIFDVGEETLLGMTAMFEYTQNDEVVGKYDDAIEGYRGVIDSSQTSLDDEDIDLPADVRERMVVMMESAYDRLAQTMMGQGKVQDVINVRKEYRDKLAALGVPLTTFQADGEIEDGKEDERFGHSFYITCAQAMADSGDGALVQQALAEVRYFNDKHPNDFVGLRAKAVLKDIMDAQASAVSGALLLEVARGDFQRKEYELAIQGAKRALAAMSAAELTKHGCESYNLMGQAYILQGRAIEATLAFKTGLERHGTTAPAEQTEQAASLVQRTMRQIKANTGSDAFFAGLETEIEPLALRYGDVADQDERKWREGLTHMSSRRWDDAIRAFDTISAAARRYENAQSRIVACYQLKKDPQGARAKIAAYRQWLTTAAANIPDDDNAKRQVREFAQAEMAFYEGYVLYEEAAGKYRRDRKKDATKFPDVVKLLNDFPQRYGKIAANLVPRVHYVLGRCHVEQGDLDKAEEKYRILKDDKAAGSVVPILATAIFSAYNGSVTAQKKEVDSLVNQGKDADARKAEVKLRELYDRAAKLGLDYFASADKPQYGISYLTLTFLEALQDWPRVESFGQKIIETFGDVAANKDKIERFVRAKVGSAMLQQQKYRQAHAMLTAAEKANEKNFPIKRLVALTLGGWCRYDASGKAVPRPGMGQPKEGWEKYWLEYKTYGLNKNRIKEYSLEWYEFYWEVYWLARQAQGADSKFEDRARQTYNIAKSIDDFAKLKSMGRAGRELYDLFLDYPPN